MPKKLSFEDLQKKIKEINEWYPEANIDITTYTNSSNKIKVIDQQYGQWWPTFTNLYLRKVKHPKRKLLLISEKHTLSLEEVKKRLEEKWGDKIKLYDQTYKNTVTKAKFYNKEYGDFWYVPQRLLRGICFVKIRNKELGKKRRKYNIQYISKKLKEIYGDEVKLDETLFEYGQKAWFIHKKYGRWYASINNVLMGHSHPEAGKEKAKKSNLERYGAEHPNQSIQSLKKSQLAQSKAHILKHWKTGEDLVTRASYEWVVVKYLNDNKIDFKWQIPFQLNINGQKRIYVCDLYLPQKDQYIEIKGYFKSQLNKLKWQTFHQQYPNSEIWYQKDVEKFVGRSRYFFLKEFKQEYSM